VESPAACGRQIAHRNEHELADEVMRRSIIASISQRCMGPLLMDSDLKPRLTRGQQTSKRDERIRERCGDACTTYPLAPQRAVAGVISVSLDEMTSINALERAASNQPL
jgi:hypothetical protein